MSDGYNGWTNYETWCVNLWLTNDQGSEEMLREWAQEAMQEAIDSEESDPRDAAVSRLAEQLESWHDEQTPSVEGVFGDLLRASLQAVDWQEIATNHLQDIEIFSAGWNMPGCMPDSEPALFIDSDDARMYISDEMDNARDSIEANLDDEDESEGDERKKVEALEDASAECLKGSGEYGATVAGYHYFVTKV